VPHNLQEFWYTATRSKTANGYGLPAEQAYRKLTAIKSLFDLLPDTNAIYTEWEGLVATHKVVGGQSFDTRLVAAMQVHGISQILTFNDAHFRRYPGITAIHPAVV
jgi:predicted nucleic acid-binding protein